jgi:hypothetical protein
MDRADDQAGATAGQGRLGQKWERCARALPGLSHSIRNELRIRRAGRSGLRPQRGADPGRLAEYSMPHRTNRGASRWATRPRPARSSLSTRVRSWEQEMGRTLRMASPPESSADHRRSPDPPRSASHGLSRSQGKGGRSPFRSARPRRSACRCHQVRPPFLSKSGLVVAPLLDGHAQMFGEEPCSAR